MNGGITLEALCHGQHASKVISPFIIFAVFDVLFRRYNLWINYRFLYLYLLFYYRGLCIQYRLPVYHNVWAGNGIEVRVRVNNWQRCFKYTSSKYQFEYKYIHYLRTGSDDPRPRRSNKTIFKMAAIRHLEFSKFGIWSSDLCQTWSCCLIPNFALIGQ